MHAIGSQFLPEKRSPAIPARSGRSPLLLDHLVLNAKVAMIGQTGTSNAPAPTWAPACVLQCGSGLDRVPGGVERLGNRFDRRHRGVEVHIHKLRFGAGLHLRYAIELADSFLDGADAVAAADVRGMERRVFCRRERHVVNPSNGIYRNASSGVAERSAGIPVLS